MYKMCILVILIFMQIYAIPVSSKETEIDAYVLSETELFYKPNDTESSIQTINSDSPVVFRPTLWGLSAQIQKDLTINTSKGPTVITANNILIAMKVSGVPGIDRDEIIFCTERKNIKVNDGWNLYRVISNSVTDGQKCLIDKNADDIADLGFLLNTGSTEDRRPKEIAPIKLNVAELRPAGHKYSVSILFWNLKRPGFYINIVHNGKTINFDSISNGGKSEGRFQQVPKEYTTPYMMNIFGAKFQILSFDRTKKQISVQFSEDSRQTLIPVPTEIFSRYRY